MKIQETKLLSSVYRREEAFSADLAKNIKCLGVGSFDEAETESRVGTRRADIVATGEYSEFWEPVRRSGLFAGKPVPVRDEAWIGKGIRGIMLYLHLYNHACAVSLYFQGDDREERRQKALELFPQEEYEYELRESPKFSNIAFPVLDKGKKDIEHWDEIRKELVSRGEEMYNRLKDSDV